MRAFWAIIGSWVTYSVGAGLLALCFIFLLLTGGNNAPWYALVALIMGVAAWTKYRY